MQTLFWIPERPINWPIMDMNVTVIKQMNSLETAHNTFVPDLSNTMP